MHRTTGQDLGPSRQLFRRHRWWLSRILCPPRCATCHEQRASYQSDTQIVQRLRNHDLDCISFPRRLPISNSVGQNRTFGRRPSIVRPDGSIDSSSHLSYLIIVEPFSHIEQKRLSAPWRKARICARILLKSDERWTSRDVRVASRLVRDGSVTNRLIDQALAHVRAMRIPK